jgi:phage shock protein A
MAHLGGMLFGFLLIRYWQKHPGSSQSFGRSKGMEFFESMKRRFDERQQKSNMHAEPTGRRETDAEYNARKRQNQEEIDAILDKIRRSGYDSLTKEEKQKLFDQSRNS